MRTFLSVTILALVLATHVDCRPRGGRQRLPPQLSNLEFFTWQRNYTTEAEETVTGGETAILNEDRDFFSLLTNAGVEGFDNAVTLYAYTGETEDSTERVVVIRPQGRRSPCLLVSKSGTQTLEQVVTDVLEVRDALPEEVTDTQFVTLNATDVGLTPLRGRAARTALMSSRVAAAFCRGRPVFDFTAGTQPTVAAPAESEDERETEERVFQVQTLDTTYTIAVELFVRRDDSSSEDDDEDDDSDGSDESDESGRRRRGPSRRRKGGRS